MLAPDPDTTTQAMQNTIGASETVTVYAGALRFVVGPMDSGSFPAWFAPVTTAIKTAVGHASDWMDDLCIDVTTTVPQTIIDFASRFDAATNGMINLETELSMGSGSATPAQKQRAIAILDDLQQGVTAASATVQSIQDRLLTLIQQVQADHDALASGSATVAQNIPDGSVITKSITADLGSDFLDITPNGPCLVSVNIKSEVSIKITQTAGTHPELLPFVVAQVVIDNAVADNAKATKAMSQMMAVWSLMQGLLQSVVDDLSQAADPKVLPILQKAEFDAARQVWVHLSEIAKSIASGR